VTRCISQKLNPSDGWTFIDKLVIILGESLPFRSTVRMHRAWATTRPMRSSNRSYHQQCKECADEICPFREENVTASWSITHRTKDTASDGMSKIPSEHFPYPYVINGVRLQKRRSGSLELKSQSPGRACRMVEQRLVMACRECADILDANAQ
jgi:hypothetical protein